MEGTSEAHQKTSPQTTSESTVKRTPVPRYYRVTNTGSREVGVIIGVDRWSSDYDKEFRETLLFHKELVETVLEKRNVQLTPHEKERKLTDKMNTILKRLGIEKKNLFSEDYELVSPKRFLRLGVQFVPEGAVFCIDVDVMGEESIKYLDSLNILQES